MAILLSIIISISSICRDLKNNVSIISKLYNKEHSDHKDTKESILLYGYLIIRNMEMLKIKNV